MSHDAIVLVAAVAVLAAASQWVAWRLRLPAILPLLLTGILVGPVAGWLDPNTLLGPLLFPFVSLAVAVILFEGSLTLRFSEIRGLEQVVRRFVTGGVLLTWAVAALAARLLTGLQWELAALFGAIMVVTGPTVIVPLLRTVRPSARVAGILRWEGIVIDPIGALLAVLVLELVVALGPGSALAAAAMTFVQTVAVGVAVGLASGYALGEALRRDWLPVYLFNATTLAAVVCAFTLADALAEESGLLAVTVMGIYLGNRKGVPNEEILEFKESLSLLLISVLFILLAARLDLAGLQALGWGAVGVFLVIQLLARPLTVLYGTWGSTLSWPERALLAWIAPRGIVAAAVSALFALKLEQRGFEQAGLLVPLAFGVILGTVVLQSLTAGPLARLLRVREPEPEGFLIVGANPVARALGQALDREKIAVLLCDTLWDNLKRARMAGLKTYYGNPLSEHAELYLDTTGLGRLLAVTPDAHLNALACSRYRGVFGPQGVFALRVAGPQSDSGRRETAPAGRIAFGKDASYLDLSRRLHLGAEIRRTTLSESFTLEDFRALHGEQAIPLFACDPKGRVEVFSAERPPEPAAGWTILALIDPDSASQSSPTGGEEAIQGRPQPRSAPGEPRGG
ncbi:MAG: cation:proton antiporter, partial [Bdellovibrio bacteriovorus]